MIRREHYLAQIEPFEDSDLIKVITGIRRCGKSTILRQLADIISGKTDNIVFLEFESKRIRSLLSDADLVIRYVDEHRKEGKCYVFLDEIQEVDNWPEICQTLRLENCSVFISGSNSKLLSSEFTEALSGRYVSFRIHPFVWKELVEYAAELNRPISVSDYLIWGGFPKRLEFEGDAMIRYLEDIDETIIYKDIIRRFKIRKESLFRAVADFVLRSNGRIVSYNSIYKAVKQKEKCSEHTIMKYVEYLEKAFATELIRQYSTKTKQELQFHKKCYNGDVALNSIRCPGNRYDIDHNLENIVYLELLYRNYQIKMYDNAGKEIDFIAAKAGKEYLIQVAHSVIDDKAYQREFNAFNGLDNARQKILITNDDMDYSTSTVRHMRLIDFLTMKDF
ncbi:MAG: ATP-binding protein [Clostridia bacterium]|nr:ATP-binding protein [Clostridia bacterium]